MHAWFQYRIPRPHPTPHLLSNFYALWAQIPGQMKHAAAVEHLSSWLSEESKCVNTEIEIQTKCSRIQEGRRRDLQSTRECILNDGVVL